MSNSPNQLILDFLDSLPSHTQEIAATICVLIAAPGEFARPGVDMVREARAMIDPDADEFKRSRQTAAAIFWCGLFDYHFAKAVKPLTGQDMHEILDDMEAEVGVQQSMRDHADNMDEYNVQYAKAASQWQALRDGNLSSRAINKWFHLRNM